MWLEDDNTVACTNTPPMRSHISDTLSVHFGGFMCNCRRTTAFFMVKNNVIFDYKHAFFLFKKNSDTHLMFG